VELDELEKAGPASETVFDLEDESFAAELEGISALASTGGQLDEGDEEDHFSDLSSESEVDLDLDADPLAIKKEESTDPAHIKDMISKLDAILKLLYNHLAATHSPLQRKSASSFSTSLLASLSTINLFDNTRKSKAPSPPPLAFTEGEIYEIQSAQFRNLLHTFERTILRTFKSRYTQFLLFWFTSLHPDFTDGFLGILVAKVIGTPSPSATSSAYQASPQETPMSRAASASYLASFVSRAKHVDGPSAQRVVTLLCTYLSRELEMYYNHVKEPVHISQYTPFYAVAQAVFLVFCFRWRDLRVGEQEEVKKDEKDEENDELGLNAHVYGNGAEQTKWIPELDVIQKIIVSPLNPLKVFSISLSFSICH
jgi:RNA polymerase I-specific transcription initiation factor RRN3